MKGDLLERIYMAASCEGSNPNKGDRISELYELRGETEKAGVDFLDALEKLTGPGDGLDRLEALYAVSADEREKQGFMNGFRLGVLLAMELGGYGPA